MLSVPQLDGVSSYGEERRLDLLHHISLSFIGMVDKSLSNDQLVTLRSDESVLHEWLLNAADFTW